MYVTHGVWHEEAHSNIKRADTIATDSKANKT
jgi:hypothetical protein